MDALAPKRCPHCIRILSTVSVDQAEEFAVRGPVLVCERCDAVPHAHESLHLPYDWD